MGRARAVVLDTGQFTGAMPIPGTHTDLPIRVGQLDADPQLEIVAAGAVVLDGLTGRAGRAEQDRVVLRDRAGALLGMLALDGGTASRGTALLDLDGDGIEVP